MADNPPKSDDAAAAKAVPKPRNPAFQMLGWPNIKLKLPSRNWLIFISVVSSWSAAVAYDRYQKRRCQRKWALLVSDLAKDPIPTNTLPRRISIFLAAPPGDGLRVAREHFHEYVRPILNAGAIDWNVIEGRREGQVRAQYAERIRRIRQEGGEKALKEIPSEETHEESIRAAQKAMNVHESSGLKGDLVLGRHTWKEYVRGLHEGWLGPLDPPAEPAPGAQSELKSSELATPIVAPAAPVPENGSSLANAQSLADISSQSRTADADAAKVRGKSEEKQEEEKPKDKTRMPPAKPYIQTAEYSQAHGSTTMPQTFDPAIALPLPHVLGFSKTPKRIARFLNKRRLADETGAMVAAIVLADRTLPFTEDSVGAIPSETSGPLKQDGWEQQETLHAEEQDWHNSTWQPNKDGDDIERVWADAMVIDQRIGAKMSKFILPEGSAERAASLEAEYRQSKPSLWTQATNWFGYGPQPKRGWEMGLEGSEDM